AARVARVLSDAARAGALSPSLPPPRPRPQGGAAPAPPVPNRLIDGQGLLVVAAGGGVVALMVGNQPQVAQAIVLGAGQAHGAGQVKSLAELRAGLIIMRQWDEGSAVDAPSHRLSLVPSDRVRQLSRPRRSLCSMREPVGH